jgi:hypothetical protein
VTALVLFFGRAGTSPLEMRLDAVRTAIAASVIARAAAAGFGPLLAVTSDADAIAAFGAAGAEIVPERTTPFHLGEELRGLARDRRLERICAIGAGAGALLGIDELRQVREDLEAADDVVLSNNYFSADLVAFTPAAALDAIDLPATDNPLPRLLHQQAGLRSRQLARSAATLLDVDTPADATVLVRHPSCPPELRDMPTWEPELGGRIEAIMELITTAERELLVAGRVGAPVWTYLESQTACRVRVLAEERGMQAAGRDVDGSARTALGFLYERIGPREFFARMAELGDGMLFDSRVLFAHLGWRPTGAQRFSSDLFDDRNAGPDLAEFTAAARDARVPLLLGGHTLVSGVLWTMVEAAWSAHPEPVE